MRIDWKKLREATGLDEAAFAQKVGVTPEMVIAWETHIVEPDAMEQKRVFALVKKITEEGV